MHFKFSSAGPHKNLIPGLLLNFQSCRRKVYAYFSYKILVDALRLYHVAANKQTNKPDDSFSLDLNLIVFPRKLHFC